MNSSSPCIAVCQLDRDNICVGCLRSIGEIAGWSQMSDAERASVNLMLAGRRAAYRPMPTSLAVPAEILANPIDFHD